MGERSSTPDYRPSFARAGPPEVCGCSDCRGPLGPGTVRVALKAAGVNFPDVLMIQGLYQHRPELPFVPGLEAPASWPRSPRTSRALPSGKR